MVRSENEARILNNVERNALFCSLKVDIQKKFTATLCAAKLLSILLAALRAAQHGLLHFRFASYTYVFISMP